jgi:hypothetical protein
MEGCILNGLLLHAVLATMASLPKPSLALTYKCDSTNAEAKYHCAKR